MSETSVEWRENEHRNVLSVDGYTQDRCLQKMKEVGNQSQHKSSLEKVEVFSKLLFLK